MIEKISRENVKFHLQGPYMWKGESVRMNLREEANIADDLERSKHWALTRFV